MLWLFLAACGDKGEDTSPAIDTAPAEAEPVICTATVPSNAWVVTTWEETKSPGAVAWVCDGAKLTVGGPGGAFFVQSGGTLELEAADGLVYALDGATVSIAESGVTVYHEPTAVVALDTIATLTRCDEIQLDVSEVPIPCE
ncbi:MAG: hypothetical protein ACI8RZ_003794 [Myxococcota bacterium]|jgi:hypothetical protein